MNDYTLSKEQLQLIDKQVADYRRFLMNQLFSNDVEKIEAFPPMDLKVGDWIYSDYFKCANKIIEICGGFVQFAFCEENGLNSGRLDHIENKTKIKSYRYATSEEIDARLESECELIKQKQNLNK